MGEGSVDGGAAKEAVMDGRRSKFWATGAPEQLSLPTRLSIEQQDELLAGYRVPSAAKAQPPPSKSTRRSHFFPRDENTRRLHEAKWEPPQSPYGLIQEQLYSDPWKVLLCCILLNKTTITQVRRVVWNLLHMCPSAEATVATDVSAIEEIIRPLGMQRKRAQDIKRFSLDYLEKEWESPLELHGIGKYGSDAYAIFCQGSWREVQPEDKELRAYHEWLSTTQGQGSGLERDAAPSDVACDESLSQ